LSDGTVLAYRTALKRFEDSVGPDRDLRYITKADAARFIVAMRDGKPKRSLATVGKYAGGLRAAFAVAVEPLGYRPDNPFSKIGTQKVGKRAHHHVEPVEFEALLTACPSLWWKAFLALLYTAGLRVNEAIALTWADVDFERDEIRVIAKREAGGLIEWQPKDKDPRTVPIPPMTVALLTRMHTVADDSPYVLIPRKRLEIIKAAKTAGVWTNNGQIVNNLRRVWLKIVKAAGVPHVTFHDLRRSAITNWAWCLPMHVVKELAGHADYKTTEQYYLTITEGDKVEARRAVEGVVSGLQTGTSDPEVTPMGCSERDSEV
jgi:integrase